MAEREREREREKGGVRSIDRQRGRDRDTERKEEGVMICILEKQLLKAYPMICFLVELGLHT